MSFDWRRAANLPILIGGGFTPTPRSFARLHGPTWLASGEVHSNVRFYKYYWRIWTARELIDAHDLAEVGRRLGHFPWRETSEAQPFSTAISAMRALCDAGERFLVIAEKVKREDPEAPWDFAALKSAGRQLAPAYDDDRHMAFFGHK